MHGYYERKINNDTQIDTHLSDYWKKDQFFTSQQENFLQSNNKNYPRNILDTKELETTENP